VKELDGSIDIWTQDRSLETSGPGRSARAVIILDLYGGRPAAGAIIIDAPATDPRATIWACFSMVWRLLFLEGVHCSTIAEGG